jgi:hypothetical protein
LNHIYKIIFTFWASLFFAYGKGQITIAGTVYDSTKIVPVKNVTIKSTGGAVAVTDTNGRYSMVVMPADSLIFIYQNKPTLKFAVKDMPNTGIFDIALHIQVNEKYKRLKEVRVYAKNYRQDSMQNRERYAKIFNYQKPGIKLNTNAYSGAVGADLNELINVFRFKRNKQLRKMQDRLEAEEREKFIDYHFSKTIVKRVTRLEGKELDEFMKKYRPSFDFTLNSGMVEFYQYMLDASYEFKLNRDKELFIDSRFNKSVVTLATGLTDGDLEIFMKRYRPSFEFTKNCTTQDWYTYINNAFAEFKQPQPSLPNISDSSFQKN